MRLLTNKLTEIVQTIISGDGFVVLEDWFDPEPINSIIHRVVDDEARGKGIFSGGYRPDVFYEDEMRDLLVDEDLLIIGQAILKDSPAYGSLGINVVPPESEGMDPHIDYPYFSMKALPRDADPALCLQFIWYPNGVESEKFGATRVVPGSQRRPRIPERKSYDKWSIPILAKPGSVFVGHGALWHGVGPNTSEIERPAVLGSYVPYWVQPMLNSNFSGVSGPMHKLLRGNFGERIGQDYMRSMAR